MAGGSLTSADVVSSPIMPFELSPPIIPLESPPLHASCEPTHGMTCHRNAVDASGYHKKSPFYICSHHFHEVHVNQHSFAMSAVMVSGVDILPVHPPSAIPSSVGMGRGHHEACSVSSPPRQCPKNVTVNECHLLDLFSYQATPSVFRDIVDCLQTWY